MKFPAGAFRKIARVLRHREQAILARARLSDFNGKWTKRMGATYVGVRRAHPYSWLLSSPQQPLETEDPPTVSLAPQYTSQRPCRATVFFMSNELSQFTARK